MAVIVETKLRPSVSTRMMEVSMKRHYQLAYERAAAEGKVPRVKFLLCGGSVIRRTWSPALGAWIEQPPAPQFRGVSTEELYRRELIRPGLLPDDPRDAGVAPR
jgi:hypothetical protein